MTHRVYSACIHQNNFYFARCLPNGSIQIYKNNLFYYDISLYALSVDLVIQNKDPFIVAAMEDGSVVLINLMNGTLHAKLYFDVSHSAACHDYEGNIIMAVATNQDIIDVYQGLKKIYSINQSSSALDVITYQSDIFVVAKDKNIIQLYRNQKLLHSLEVHCEKFRVQIDDNGHFNLYLSENTDEGCTWLYRDWKLHRTFYFKPTYFFKVSVDRQIHTAMAMAMVDDQCFLYYGSNRADAFKLCSETPISLDEKSIVQLNKVIGKGSYGTVYRGLYRNNPVAIKCFRDEHSLCGENLNLSLLHHPNIVTLLTQYRHLIYGFSHSYTMPLEDTSLWDYLHVNQPLPSAGWHPQYNNLVFGIASALQYLEKNRLVHGDLKTANVLISSDGNSKLCDFGSMHVIPSDSDILPIEKNIMTLCYAAPESIGYIIKQNPPFMFLSNLNFQNIFSQVERTFPNSTHQTSMIEYAIGIRSDIFSLGVILWEMCTGKVPWYNYKEPDIVFSIRSGRRLQLNGPYPRVLKDVIHQCFFTKPSERPSPDDLMSAFKDFKNEVNLEQPKRFLHF